MFPGIEERGILCIWASVGSEATLALGSVSSAMVGTNGSCLFAVGLPAVIVGSQYFKTFLSHVGRVAKCSNAQFSYLHVLIHS